MFIFFSLVKLFCRFSCCKNIGVIVLNVLIDVSYAVYDELNQFIL